MGRDSKVPRDEIELLKNHETLESFADEFIAKFKERYPILKIGKHVTNMFYRKETLLKRLDAENRTVLVPRTITHASERSPGKRNNFVDIDAVIVELKNNSEIEKQVLSEMLAELKIQTDLLSKQYRLFEKLSEKQDMKDQKREMIPDENLST